MPRIARIDVPGLPYHICIRAVDGMPCFSNEVDCLIFYNYFRDALGSGILRLHAHVVMTNHVHILATPLEKGAMAQVMSSTSQRFAQHFNRAYDRRGPLLQDRFWSSPIEADSHFFATQRYIELNPVRAGMVAGPGDYRWSSYLHNTGRERIPEITFHSQYLELGLTPEKRASAWERIVMAGIPADELKLLRKRFTRNHPLGSTDFGRRFGFELVS
jgi:putative transposase